MLVSEHQDTQEASSTSFFSNMSLAARKCTSPCLAREDPYQPLVTPGSHRRSRQTHRGASWTRYPQTGVALGSRTALTAYSLSQRMVQVIVCGSTSVRSGLPEETGSSIIIPIPQDTLISFFSYPRHFLFATVPTRQLGMSVAYRGGHPFHVMLTLVCQKRLH